MNYFKFIILRKSFQHFPGREKNEDEDKDNNLSYKFIKWIGFEEFGKKIYVREDFLNEKESEYW